MGGCPNQRPREAAGGFAYDLLMAATESNGQLVRRGEGRDALGRFSTGWKGGPGNPYAPQVARWRRELYACVTDDDIRQVMRVLVDTAKSGSPWAIHELLNRLVGKPPSVVAVALPDES